ncbi:MAG: hypothetical protein O9329_18270 [Microcystis sp. LE19-12.2C]|nr:hypothetical protein [Microcystis sp. LE19-12.2C]MCZ8085157.1 hypothetical protein [Paracoccaceae bacterium]
MFQSLKKTLAATVLTALTATTAAADQPIYGNVTAKDMYTLFAGKVLVRHLVGAEKYPSEVHTLQVTYFASNGTTSSCAAYDGYVDGKTGNATWKPVIIDNKVGKERYPLLEVNAADGAGYGLYIYDANTGGIDGHGSINGRWRHVITGHIQSDIPAAVYTMCPDFPSAESLGTRVNTKQTSTNYRAMVAQDPGKRVLRPDLVTDVTVEKY